VFKSSIAKILIIALFLKIMSIMNFDYFFIVQFFLASFRPSPKLSRHICGPFASYQWAAAHLRALRVIPACRDTPAGPSRHTSVPRHTCGPFVSYERVATHLRALRVTPVCRGTPVANRCSRLWGSNMSRAGSGLWLIVGCGVTCIEPLNSVTSVLVSCRVRCHLKSMQWRIAVGF
jgi:hypothetical protein